MDISRLSLFSLEAQSIEKSNLTTSINSPATMNEHSQMPQSTALALDDSMSPDASISDWLSRKVRVATFNVSVGGSLRQEFNPWLLYLGNTNVIKKIDNFNLLKANMVLTFTINGTPFHSGLYLASYAYLNERNEGPNRLDFNYLINHSQRPHLYLNPSTCKGGCLCVPFFHPQNYLRSNSNIVPANSMLRVNLDSVTPLRQLNAGTDDITITVFAHLEDVVLSGPTTQLSAQAGSCVTNFAIFELQSQGSEYKTSGVVSGPASAVAAIAGRLTELPCIGPFALATSIGATAVGGIARLFGYSKPPQISDVTRVRNTPSTNLALCEGTDMSQKLTVTAKQEISIDPRTVGMPVEDNLSLDYFTKRESIYASFTWDPTRVVGAYLFASAIHPMLEATDTTATPPQVIYDPTSLSFVSRMFSEWSGSIKIRFQIIASQYHRGRMVVFYDPIGLAGSVAASPPYNQIFNTIIDLAEGRDFTLTFNWQREVPYCAIKNNTDSTEDFTTVDPISFVPSQDYANGAFYVSVVNELTTPDAVTPVEVLLSISAGDDFELVNPSGTNMELGAFDLGAQSGECLTTFSLFDLQPQSAVEVLPDEENAPEEETNEITVTSDATVHRDEKALMFYGERVTSLRQLLKRSCYYRTITSYSSSSDVRSVLWRLRAMPLAPGYDPNGQDTVTGGVQYNLVNYTYITYLRRAFAGWRGSIRWKFFPASNLGKVSVQRATGSQRDLLASYVAAVASQTWSTFITNTQLVRNELRYFTQTGGGEVVTQPRTMDSLEVEIPYAVPLKFSRTTLDYMGAGDNGIDSACPGGDSFLLLGRSVRGDSAVIMDAYVSAGEDFMFTGFIGAPRMYYNPLPTA